MSKPVIRVGRPVLRDRSVLECEMDFDGSGLAGRFTGEPFYAAYDGVDLHGVDEGIRGVPVIANLAPIAWHLGAVLRVSVLDEAFLAALGDVHEALRKLYPQMEWQGRVVADEVTGDSSAYGERSAMLFSGGVDSRATYVARRHEHPLLITVWGADIWPTEEAGWARVHRHCADFARASGLAARFIKSNVRTFYRTETLPFGWGWWTYVQHGLGLLGLCAPLAGAEGIGRLYIPSTHTSEFTGSWGSHPWIDNQVRWSGTRGFHEGYHRSRQQKMALIADSLTSGDVLGRLRVCWKTQSGENCSRCVKCAQTITGLVILGLDPNRHGFKFGSDSLLHFKAQLENRAFLRDPDDPFVWGDLQRFLPTAPRLHVAGLDEYVQWLKRFDFEKERVQTP